MNILNSTLIRVPATAKVAISHSLEKKDLNRAGIRVVDTSDPDLWKNKALFSCWERSLHDSRGASHKQHNSLTSAGNEWRGWELGAKPQRQSQNPASEHQPPVSAWDTDVCFSLSPSTGQIEDKVSCYSCCAVESSCGCYSLLQPHLWLL